MIYNLSHNDRKIKLEIDQQLGKAYSLLERIRMQGNGSPGLLISDADESINALLSHDGSLRKCNIELRPKGLIIGFKQRLETYGWIVPFHTLHLFKSDDSLRIYAGKHHLSLQWKGHDKPRDRFLLKLLQHKASHAEIHYSDPSFAY